VCRSCGAATSLVAGLKRAFVAVGALISRTVLRLLAMPTILVAWWSGVRWSGAAHVDWFVDNVL
jgi:hypothetical protein